MREYLRSTLHQYQEKDLSFSQFIKDVIDQLRSKAKEFSNKKIFWNQNEREIRDGDEKLSKEYAVPIVI
ncbi:MAG TPA: hypothetical protein PLM44_03060 [bacterium]|nr:hypothetical protein [bacterium]